jgi:predicted metal-binding membrane protein
MASAALSSTLPRRNRIAVLTGLGGITLLAWIYLLVTAREMSSMKSMVGLRVWTGTDFILMFFMWAIMMIGMMVPAAAPMTVLYAAVARKAANDGSPISPTSVFVTGYVVTWLLFSVAATAAQWMLQRAALLSSMMVTTSPLVGAGILIAAGLYQWTPVKMSCLKRCRAPLYFLSEHWRDGTWGAFQMGFRYGALCVGCCGPVMFLLFIGGVMNILWIAAIAVFVLIEKITPLGVHAGRAAGVAMIVLGVLALARFTLVS